MKKLLITVLIISTGILSCQKKVEDNPNTDHNSTNDYNVKVADEGTRENLIRPFLVSKPLPLAFRNIHLT